MIGNHIARTTPLAGLLLLCCWCISCVGPMVTDAPRREHIQRIFLLDGSWFLDFTVADEEVAQRGARNSEKQAVVLDERHFAGISWRVVDEFPEYCRMHQIPKKSPIHVLQAGGTEEDYHKLYDTMQAAGLALASYRRLSPKNASERSLLEHLPPKPATRSVADQMSRTGGSMKEGNAKWVTVPRARTEICERS